MAEIRVYPQGFRELARRLGGMQVARVLEPPMVRGLERFRSDLSTYPPAPPESSYVRTGTLGRSWAIDYTINARGMSGETGTAIPYAPYVQDAERQAWMHEDRWRNTDVAVAQRHRGAILANFSTTIQTEFDRGR